MVHVGLLRGINVGGKAKLPMKELTAIFAAAGGRNVRTYIQSGNVVFEAMSPEAAKAVVDTVTREIATVYGYPGRIVLRSAEELRAAYARNPFLEAAGKPGDENGLGAVGSLLAADAPAALIAMLHVYFLADVPAAAAVKALDRERSPGDSFVVRGREVYLHLPQGMARTKLTNAYFDGKLKTVSTARNWNTVEKLVEMCR